VLVIRRKSGESILIGSDVEVQIIEVTPSRVKIGITAPSEVLILRKEIQLAQQENLAAARGVSVEGIRAAISRIYRSTPGLRSKNPQASPISHS